MTDFRVGDKFVLDGSKVEHVIQQRFLFTVNTACGVTHAVVNLRRSIGENRPCKRCEPSMKMLGAGK